MDEQRSKSPTGVIVVGVDASPGSNQALRWAVDEASLCGSSIQAIHAWDTPMPVSTIGSMSAPPDPELCERHAKAVLHDAVAEATTEGAAGVSIDATLAQGYAPDVLLGALDGADLLVVGSRGLGGFRGLLLGSVGQHCVHHATKPVAIVRKDSPLPDAGDVVVGVDGSPGSQLALEWALDEAAVRHARLAVVHAWWTPYTVPSLGIAVPPTDPAGLTEQSERMMRQMVDAALASAERTTSDIELLPMEMAPADGLLTRAKGAGLLVVGSRGRGGFAGLLLGSVSQQCLHHADCAVIVVPGPRR